LEPLDLSPNLPPRDRKFVEQLADNLRLPWTTALDEHGERFIRLQIPSKNGNAENGDADEEEEEEEEDEEASVALRRVLKKYDNAKVQDISA
jgi:5'-3' exoribonuclease 1